MLAKIDTIGNSSRHSRGDLSISRDASIVVVQEWPPLVVHMDDVELFVFAPLSVGSL